MTILSMTISNNEKMCIFLCNFSFYEQTILVRFIWICSDDSLPCTVGVSELHFCLFFLNGLPVLFWLWYQQVLFGFFYAVNGIYRVIFRTVPMFNGPDRGVGDIVRGFVVVETVEMGMASNMGNRLCWSVLCFGF